MPGPVAAPGAAPVAVPRRPSTLPLRLLQDADERQVAVPLAFVETVPDDEEVGDGEAEVLDGDRRPGARRLVEQRADLDRGRVPRRQVVEEVAHGQPGVDDVL